MQVNEGAEEIGKGGAQENEVDETEIDGADTWVSLPDQTLIWFDHRESAQNNDDWKEVLEGEKEVERGHSDPLEGIEREFVTHNQIDVVKVSNYFVYAPTYHPKCDPLVVRILKNYAEENEVRRKHIQNEVTFQALNSDKVVRNLNESRKFK